MNESMRAKLAQLARRLQEIDTALSMPDAARDLDQFRRLSRERADIEPVVARYHEYVRAQADLVAAQDLIGDPEMRTLAEEESGSVRRRLETLESDLQRLLLPVDPNETFSWKFVPARAARSRRCSPLSCFGCTCATRSGGTGRPR